MPFSLIFFLLAAGLASSAAAAPGSPEPLRWEAPSQTNHAQAGDVSSRFTFKVANVSASDVFINDVKNSCGCTTTQLPSKPWRLAPKETGQLQVLVDLRAKTGILSKTIEILSSNAPKELVVTVEIAPGANGLPPEMANRLFGQQLAIVDRQSVFTKTECLQCHLKPAFGKSGAQLYAAACGICHESPHRATMVPDLHALKADTTPVYWRNMVAHGKPGTLMPGFEAAEGGPLTDAQIGSLVEFLSRAFPRHARSKPGDGDNTGD